MTATVHQIAADTVAKMARNPHGYTAETLVAKWEADVEWLGLKVGGKAWQREVFSRAKNGWIATTQQTTHFIPPSEETLAWGGFLGGEHVATQELRDNAEAAFARTFGY